MSTDPQTPEALKDLGNARRSAGDPEGALKAYRRALAIAPDYLPALYNLGLVLHELNRLDEAEQAFRRVEALDASDTEALIHLAAVLAALGRWQEAEAAACKALRRAPENPLLWVQLAFACKGLGRLHDASEAYRKALGLDPNIPEAHNGLGNILQDEGRVQEAIEHYRNALRISPEDAIAYSNLGCALVLLGGLDEANGCFLKATSLAPRSADAHMNLGSLRSQRGELEPALESFRTALELRPGDAAIRECVLAEMQQICDWSRFDELCAAQRASLADPTQRISPFSLLSIPSSPAEQLRCAEIYSAKLSAVAAEQRRRLDFASSGEAEHKLTIGYLSSDFHEHATAYLAAELFELHDRGAFRIFAYSYGRDDGSPMRKRLKAAFDRFVDIQSASHAEAASAIHRDKVDILVDLKGYTTHARPEILALRPAPVQASYLGYPGTMGAEFIDYLIADRFVVPASQAAFYREALVALPGCYQVNDRRRSLAPKPSRRDLAIPQEAFVYCCFNQPYKILRETFSLWMRLLRAVPNSVLWLLDWNPWASGNLRREAERSGVSAERLVFGQKLPLEEHLARLSTADLFLDSFPYNAHTMASDALWAGVPVVTRAGDTFASRVAGSLLTAVGLPELIAPSASAYEEIALRLAGDPSALASVRGRLSRARQEGTIFDTPRFARDLERAYQAMWARARTGKPPETIEL